MNNPKGIAVLVAVVITAGLFSGCVMNKLDESVQTIRLKGEDTGKAVRIDITKGVSWSDRMKAGPFIFNVLPQIVVWTEDENGRLIDTLYVTGANGKKMRHAAKKEKGSAFYTECFPVWALKMDQAGKPLPSNSSPYPDTITSATPQSSFTLETTVAGTPEPRYILAEINKSNDTNTRYTDENNDWAGQPSLIYQSVLDTTNSGTIYVLRCIGHGGMLNDPPRIYSDLSAFDTALTQISEIRVSFK